MTPINNDIANELQVIIPGAEWPGLKPPFGEAPDGYFDQLPDLIMQKVHAVEVQEELEGLSPLLAAAPKTFPAVESEYFDQLPDLIMQKINAREELESISPFLAEIPGISPLPAPVGYFDQLPEMIMQKIEAQEELEAISPLLAEMPKTIPMSAPAGYFDQFSDTVLAAVQEAPAAPKVVRMRIRPLIRWAAAASLLALVSTSTLLFLKNNQYNQSYSEVNFSEISDQEIVDYLQAHMDAFDKEELATMAPAGENAPIPAAGDLSTEDIQSYLDNAGLLNESPPTDN
ncbi:hypothetical protein [Chitinophaga tropicalis]|uniref:Uncharacterized protein n=1 Tax=Chitinophaga tropicalis TaxID=2683588 RepID=A0A7K1TX14_9BACT|nr:hypothetical protein [Chitinophaga tropicalis]MVT06648.1 hypothetical protein [Chitinophaga tropicalis]